MQDDMARDNWHMAENSAFGREMKRKIESVEREIKELKEDKVDNIREIGELRQSVRELKNTLKSILEISCRGSVNQSERLDEIWKLTDIALNGEIED
jgi:succinate dehydrogenase/fumarate reductase flavoprotein subunit